MQPGKISVSMKLLRKINSNYSDFLFNLIFKTAYF
nr:MAG TPA: hypothetical protein [Caudoviricetes sp.]